MLIYQKNDFGFLALLPDGRGEVLSLDAEAILLQIENGSCDFNSKEMNFFIQNDFEIDLDQFHFNAPAIAFLEVTNRCNLSCLHCYANSSPQNQRPNELSLDEIKSLLDLWEKMGVLQVFLSGGELFTHPEAATIINYARQKRFLTQVFSNGLLITEEILSQITKETSFFISFDSATSDNSIRGRMSYEKLDWLLKTFKKYNHVCRLAVNVHSKNLDEVESIFHWCRNNGHLRPQWLETYPVGRATKNPDLLIRTDQSEKVKSIYKNSISEYLTSNSINSNSTAQAIDTIKLCQRFQEALHVDIAGRMIAYVNSIGNVYPSSNFAAHDREKAGSIRDHSFAEIWKYGFTKSRSYSFDHFKDCAQCPVQQAGVWCQFRCRSLSENLHGTPFKCGATEHHKQFVIWAKNFADEIESNNLRLVLN